MYGLEMQHKLVLYNAQHIHEIVHKKCTVTKKYAGLGCEFHTSFIVPYITVAPSCEQRP